MSKTCQYLRRCSLTLLASAVSLSLHAQQPSGGAETNKASAKQLDAVVVTAGGFEQVIADAPASISVLSREELETQPFHSLQDALRNVEGVSVVGASVNKQDIMMRGMPGNYTLILVDGLRQSTRENSLYEDAGQVQSSQIPPLAAIDRIEVVRGPMSSLYGSDAMGGVVNVITRQVGDHWTGTVDMDLTAQQHSDLGNNRGGGFYLGGPLKQDLVGLQVFGKLNDRSEANQVDGSWGSRDQGGTARMTITPGEYQKLILEAGWHELERSATPEKTLATTSPLYFDNRRTNLALGYDGSWDFGTTTINLYREIGKTHNELNDASTTVYPDNTLTNTVLEGSVTVPLAQHSLTSGAQYMRSELSGLGNEAADSSGTRNDIDSIKNDSWAVFVEDEYRPVDALALTGGVRFNHDERYSGNWSPRIYAVYHVTEKLTLRSGVSRAFRAPTLRQSSAEYSMSEGVGLVGVPVGVLPGNPELKPETSTSSEIGLRFEGDSGLIAGVTVFNNDFKNKIFSQCVQNCSGTSGALYAWGNIGKAVIRGVESSLQWPLDEDARLSANYTYTHSERLTDDETAFDGTSLKGQPLERTPRQAFNLRADWQVTDAFSTYFSVSCSSRQVWANFRNSANYVRTRPGSTSYDLGGGYKFSDHLSLRLALLNITDKRVPVDYRNRNTGLDGNWQVDEGRRLWASLGLSF